RVEAKGSDTNKLRKQVDFISAAISKRMKRERGTKIITTGRRLDPVWENRPGYKRERSGWQMVQSGRITSTRLNAVSDWLEDIEQLGAHLKGLRFRVSDKLLKATQERLRLNAIERFKDKSSSIAKGLNATSYCIARLQTDSHRPAYPMQRDRTFAMAESVSASSPALEAGESKVSVTVYGEIEVEKQKFPVE
ncbi:MAG: SIMPL domain-containing protein, partial [Mariprofundaceae bacterium]